MNGKVLIQDGHDGAEGCADSEKSKAIRFWFEAKEGPTFKWPFSAAQKRALVARGKCSTTLQTSKVSSKTSSSASPTSTDPTYRKIYVTESLLTDHKDKKKGSVSLWMKVTDINKKQVGLAASNLEFGQPLNLTTTDSSKTLVTAKAILPAGVS